MTQIQRQPLAILYAKDRSYQQVMTLQYAKWYCNINPSYAYKALPTDCDAVQMTVVQPLPEQYKGKIQ